MAYDSSRNYAQEIQDLIKKGGDPAKVNQLLNERLEKQQSMDTGYSTYDDVYREAMDYMAGKGYTTQASANVDYAEIANQILASQGAEADDMTHRSWSDLGTVLDAREKKLATGQYNDWANSTIGEGGMAYNGEDSVHQMLKDYATYTKMEQDYYRNLAANILRGQSGGGYSGGYGGGAVVGGYAPVSGPVAGVGGSPGGGSVGYGGSGVKVTADGAPSVTIPTYTDEEWAKKQTREAAQNAVGVTNAATRVPVQGENSSYVQANTERAFDEAIRALLESDDPEAAAAMERARQEYEISGIADPLIPGVVPSETTKVGEEKKTTKTETAGSPVPVTPSTPSVTMPGYSAPGQTGGGNMASQLTDAEIDALLADLGLVQTPVFSFAGVEFDNSTLGSERGDTAKPAVNGGYNSGGTVTRNPVVAPVTQNMIDVDAAYQVAMDAARAAGDYGSVNQIANDWNRYREETGQVNPQDVPQQYRVWSNQAGDQSMMVTPNQMENFVDKGLIEVQTKPDGSYMYILRDRFTR